jgi:hypothetical protein
LVEDGFNHVALPNVWTSEVDPALVGNVVTNTGVGGGDGHVTIHFAQQTPAGYPKNEVFCSFGT